MLSSRLLLHRRGKDCKARGWCHRRYLSPRTFLPCRFSSSFSLPQWWIQQCNRSGSGSLQSQCGLGKLEANPVFCLHPRTAVDTANCYKQSVFFLGQRKGFLVVFFPSFYSSDVMWRMQFTPIACRSNAVVAVTLSELLTQFPHCSACHLLVWCEVTGTRAEWIWETCWMEVTSHSQRACRITVASAAALSAQLGRRKLSVWHLLPVHDLFPL